MTYRDVYTFVHVAGQWLKAHPGDSKFAYVLNRVIKRAQPIMASYSEQLEDLRVEHGATDPATGVLLRDPGPNGAISLDKAGQKAWNTATRALYLSNVRGTIEPHFVAEVPPDVTEDVRDLFVGFVIEPQPGAEKEETDEREPAVQPTRNMRRAARA